MNFQILSNALFEDFKSKLRDSPFDKISRIKPLNISVDYFQFYKSVSTVYSSKIEGEEIDFDSYFKHKFLKINFKTSYTQKADDLYSAYNFIDNEKLNLKNIQKAHAILSKHLLPKSYQGIIRTNPMFVINNDDKIEYVAATPEIVNNELSKLFHDIDLLLNQELDSFEIFFYAAYIHLVFVKIHPFQDGNGRTARLVEKWFLKSKIGSMADCIQLEKNYFKNLDSYYSNIKKLGNDYSNLNYSKALDFLMMTTKGIDQQG